MFTSPEINLMRLRQEFQQSCDDLLQRFNETEQRRIHREPAWPPEYDRVDSSTTSTGEKCHEHLEGRFWPVSPKESCSSSSSSASPSLDLPSGIESKNPVAAAPAENALSILQPKPEHEAVALTILSIPDICKQ